ncbi:hypothetical protein [Leptospira kirschneri]|uniref:hypothetical protein n=1 Tax=Leptospira kirschneri TaxID=29507 RepID=UPI0009E5CC34
MPILREAFAEFSGSLEVTKAVSLLRSLEVTQRLASTVARSNSASRFYGRSTGSRCGVKLLILKKLNV